MAKGKFSSPRPYREEDRQIEKAYRQLTGQEPPPDPQDPLTGGTGEDPLLHVPEDAVLFPEAEASSLFPETDTSEHFPEAAASHAPQFSSSKFFPEETPMEEASGEDVWEEEDKTFLDKLLDFGEKAVDFCSKNKKIVLVGLCAASLAVIVGVISVFFASASDPYDRKILNNVYVAGVNVGGMTKKEAVNAVKRTADAQLARQPMTVTLAGASFQLSPADVSPKLNVNAAVNAAYDYGRTGTNAEKNLAYQNSLYENYYVPLSPYLELNERRIREALETYAAEAGNTMTQTQYGLEGKMPELSADKFDENAPCQTLVITMGTPGIKFDVSSVMKLILDAYGRFEFQVTVEDLEPAAKPDPIDLDAVYQEFYIAPVDASVKPGSRETIPASYGYGFDLETAKIQVDQAEYGQELWIPMEYIEPDILEDELLFRDILGEYQTSFGADADRANNLRLACQALDGKTLEPGETFSFNDTLGQRTTGKGYRYAKADPNSDEDVVVGGGITQAASTLYYCALLSEMEITARSSHAFPVSYIDYGLDADIQWNRTDLKFKNTTSFPVKIEAEANASSVSVRILGTDQRSYYVKLESRIQNTYVPDTEYKDLAEDNQDGYRDGDVIQKGRSGFHIKSYKLKYDRQTNELISREALADSRYQTVNEIIARIEAAPTTEPTVAPTEQPTTQPSEETTAETTEETTEETTKETTEEVIEDDGSPEIEDAA